MYQDKVIVLNAHHIDIHPYEEVMDTIFHEVAHALCPRHGHDDVWATKAREIGCTNTFPCSHLNLPEHVIDAIRSGDMVEVVVEEKKIEQIVRNVTHKITRLQDKCPDCGKVAVEKFAIETVDKEGNQIKLITLECFHIIKKIIPRATPFESFVSNGWKEEIKNCKHVWTKNTCDVCGENRLFNFQVIGARAAEAGLAMQRGFGIFDDMGLGKTNQGIAVTYYGKYRRTMVVTKSAIKFQWFKAFITWAGPDYMAQIISTSKDYLYPNMRVYIIPYDLLRRFPQEKLHALNIDLIILDECQQIKNPDSSRTQEVRKLIAANPDCKVLPLSGTPWKNRGDEFFPVLNMMDRIKFPSHQRYLDNWVEYYWQGNKRKMGGIKNPKKFREYTANLIIRREYEEVMDEFPTINRMKLPVKLDDLQQSTYDDSVSEFVAWYNDYVIGGEEDKISSIEILAKMSRMRHITGLAKIPATLGFVEEFINDTDKKLVIFVEHKDVGVLMSSALQNTDKISNPDWWELAQQLKDDGIKVFQYTSLLTGKPEGYQMQEDFNNTKRCVMVASTRACGEGLNLQTCSDSILHERQWNPQNEDQATPGRFRRIGQTSNQINITLPEAEDTVDAHLDFVVEDKRGRYHVVMNKGEVPKWNETEFAKSLAELIVKKHNEKMKRNGKTVVKTNVTGAAQLR
jgi:SNF2 family DNA or RNA helicase